MGGFFGSKVKIGIVALLGLLVITGLTVVILSLLQPHPHIAVNQAQRQPKPTPHSLVTQFQQSGTIPALSGFTQQPSSATSGGLVYREQGQAYDVYMTSPDAVVYSAAKPLNFSTVAAQVTSMLKPYALTATRTDTSTVTPATTYAGDAIICRLGGSQAGQTASYQFVCLAKDSVTTEYAAVAKLLALYKKAEPGDTLSFTLASRTYTKQDNKQSDLLSLTSADNHTKPRMLLFGAVDGVWEYIADINSGTVNQGKYMISDTALQALHNPKYGDFLLKQLP